MAERPASPLVTVVCPVFNEETCVPLFYARLLEALKVIDDKVRFELLFVNNRSTDRTLETLEGLRAKDPRVQVVTMSRNFGYQASISAGMGAANGDAIVNIDVDCEDPPEMIPRFIEKWLAGADVVYGIRHKREEFVLMHLARKLFYRVIRGVADHEIVLDMAEFLLVDRRVRDQVLSTRSTFPWVRGQVGYVGFRREGIQYKRERRLSGETHYNVLSAFKFGLGGILSSSTMPLRVLAYVGVMAFVLDVVAAVWLFARELSPSPLPGASLVAVLVPLLLLHFGWLALAIGTLGLYIARIYKDSIGLPLYVVDDHASHYKKLPHANSSP